MPRYLNRPESGMETLGQMVGVLRGLQGLQAGEEDQQVRGLEVMKLMRELEGPSPREKWGFEQEKFRYELFKDERARRDEQTKYLLNTFTEMYKTASPASKLLLGEMISKFEGTLSPEEKGAVGMVLRHSPMNELAQKAEWFDRTVPKPEVTADPQENPYGFASQLFALEDWSAQREHFMTGATKERRQLMGIGEDSWALRDGNGMISLMKTGDLALNDLAKKYDVTPGQLLRDQGWVKGTPRTVRAKGFLKEVTPVTNVFTNEAGIDERPLEGALGDLSRDEQGIAEFLAAAGAKDISMKNQGSRNYLAFQEIRSNRTDADALRFLGSIYPGWHFNLLDPATRWKIPVLKWEFFTGTDKEQLVAWPGVFREALSSDGKAIPAYWDERSGRVYDAGNGAIRADSWEEFAAAVGGKTYAELGGK